MTCHYRCSHSDCIEQHALERSECVLGCGAEIGTDPHVEMLDGPAHLDCHTAFLDAEAAARSDTTEELAEQGS